MYSVKLLRTRSEPTGVAMRASSATMTTMTAHGCATTRRDRRLKTPSSEEESPTAASTRRTPGTLLSALGRTSRRPSRVMTAGTSVSVHVTASRVTTTAPAAIVLSTGERMTSRPAIEQAMVSAENETVRPAVATVRTTTCRTSSPAASPRGGSAPASRAAISSR